jgi:hypothetical protein
MGRGDPRRQHSAGLMPARNGAQSGKNPQRRFEAASESAIMTGAARSGGDEKACAGNTRGAFCHGLLRHER